MRQSALHPTDEEAVAQRWEDLGPRQWGGVSEVTPCVRANLVCVSGAMQAQPWVTSLPFHKVTSDFPGSREEPPKLCPVWGPRGRRPDPEITAFPPPYLQLPVCLSGWRAPAPTTLSRTLQGEPFFPLRRSGFVRRFEGFVFPGGVLPLRGVAL